MVDASLLRRTCMLAALAAAAIAAAAGAAKQTPAGARPQRIVSLNLCADQLLLALADRGQIAGVSRNAASRDMSAEAARARGLRILGSSAEELLAIRPDLILGMPGRGSALGMIRDKPYRIVDIPPADSLDDIFASIRKTARAVGHRDRGEALITRMQRELAALPRPGHGKVAAYYQRRGYMTGTGTLVDDLMGRVGLVNLAGRLGKSPLAQVSLEEMVAARPDYLIVESATDRVTDQGTEMLHHPALRAIPRISIPEAWTVCGGPAYALAARSIAQQIARHREGRAP
jgi:iron complex transport system substrate-binding protein